MPPRRRRCVTSWLVPRCVAQRPKPLQIMCTSYARAPEMSAKQTMRKAALRAGIAYTRLNTSGNVKSVRMTRTVPGPQNPSRPTSSVSPQAVPSVIIAPKCDHIALIALQALSQAHPIKRLLSSRDLEDGALQVRPQVLGLLEPDAAPDEGGNQRSSEAIRGHQRSSGARAPRAQHCT